MTSPAQITLFLSSTREHIIALPGGTRHAWAVTALDLAGFTRQHDGIHALALTDPAAAREALAHLTLTASSCQVLPTISDRPYLGDIASDITALMPGRWQVTTENFALSDRRQDIASWLWGPESLTAAITRGHVPCGAVLSSPDNREFLLVELPSDSRYILAAFVPEAAYLDLPVPAPLAVTAPTPQSAASALRTRLLPTYERAVRLAHLHEAQEDLTWAQETFKPGTMSEPYPSGLADKLEAFRTHVPEFIDAIRHDPHVLTPDAAAFADRIEAALGTERPATEETGAPEAMALWLAEGKRLIELARAAMPTAEPPTASATACPAQSAPAPPPPPAPEPAHGKRR
ncbi:hypothetical protein ACWGDX_19290 [Streptomyces sp. NPDC055025]